MYNYAVQSFNISEFREKLLTLFESLPPEGVLVTKRGKPVAQVLPVRKPGKSLIGAMAKRFEIRGEILSTGETWDAER